MKNNSKIICLVLSSLLFTTIIHCQDSLYLIGTITGESTTDMITDVKGIGDINGDGYDDFIVSSGYHTVKLYLGSSNFNLTPDIIFHYPDKESLNSIGGGAGIGDVNGDGYNDFLLRGSFYDVGGKGKVFLFYGGPKIDTIPVKIFSEPWIQDWFGHTMQGVGDINKDGYADFVIGSPYNWTDGKGRVYLFWGGDTISWERCTTFTSDSLGDQFGSSVANIGDINGDGYDDLAIGAPQSGKVYIYYGGKTLHTTPDSILTADHLDVHFGRKIESSVNVRKNGVMPFFIGGLNNVFVYNGLTQLIKPIMNNGYDFCSGDDINGDGYYDLIMGNKNGINVYYSNPDGFDTTVDCGIPRIDSLIGFGSNISIAGDINGDGFAEIFALAPNWPNVDYPQGIITIYSHKRFTSVKGRKEITPSKYELYQNFPNPFNPNTVINYQLLVTCYVNLKVYDMLGREIKTLVDEKQNAGMYRVNFNGSNLASGIYFVRFTSTSQEGFIPFTKTMKMLMIK